MKRAASFRAVRFDIAYRDVVEDEPVCSTCHDHCGIPLTKRALDAMNWSAANEQHKHGQHVYCSRKPD
jgi:hypothetical protein